MSKHKHPNDEDSVVVNDVVFSFKDIFTVVNTFYTQIQSDPILSVPFQSVHDWPEHIERLTHFWWIRFGGKPYMFSDYNPVAKHFFAGFNGPLLFRWLSLFHKTLSETLTNPQATMWAVISERMGHSLAIRNEMFRQAQQK